MQYELILQPEALEDIQVAFDWYEEQRTGLGNSLMKEISICVDKISTDPLQYGFVNKWVRKIKLNKFPFLIVFEIISDKVYVYSVLHTSRKPKH